MPRHTQWEDEGGQGGGGAGASPTAGGKAEPWDRLPQPQRVHCWAWSREDGNAGHTPPLRPSVHSGITRTRQRWEHPREHPPRRGDSVVGACNRRHSVWPQKRRDTPTHATAWMGLDPLTLSERSQHGRPVCVSPRVPGDQNRRTTETESHSGSRRGRGRGTGPASG